MLISAVRQQVLALLDSVQPESRYKVLVLDSRAKQIIDLVCDKHDLLNRQVANVLMLDEPRPTEGYLEAIYIVEQSAFSFGCIQADFVRMPKRYACAHVFLLPRLKSSASELQRFENSSIHRYLKSVGPAPLSIYALEQRLFTLGLEQANTVFYNPACKDMVLELVDQTGRQLATLCEALTVNPYVRFSARWQRSRTNAFPALVAKSAAQHIDTARQRFMTPQLELEARPTLLILDRTVDLTAPLRHEFGFQSMALDVLSDQITPSTTLNHFTSSDGATKGLISDKDNAWVDLRHKHIVTVTEELTERIRELRATNPHLADPTTDVTVNDVRNMLAGLPEFMKERESVTLSLDMAMECMSAVEKLRLKEVAELEQTLALGTTAQTGDRPLESQLAEALVVVLSHKSLDRETKIRALALYAVHRRGMHSADLDRLKFHARLQDEDIAVIVALEYLGWPIVYRGESVEKIPGSLLTEYREQPLLFARIKPGLQNVCEQFIAGKMDVQQFPYSGDVPDSAQEAISTATSLRNPRQRATWAQNVSASSTSPSTSLDGGGSSSRELLGKKPRKIFIVFVIGGVTASEAAAAYELSESTGFSLLIGGHDLLTPSKFINFLGHIRSSREQLHLIEDEPARAVPAFLSASDRQNQRTQAGSGKHPGAAAGAPGAAGAVGAKATASSPAGLAGGRGYGAGPGMNQGGARPGNHAGMAPGMNSNQPSGQNAVYGQPYGSQLVGQSLDSKSMAPGAPKEKKDIKHRLKGAFKKKK